MKSIVVLPPLVRKEIMESGNQLVITRITKYRFCCSIGAYGTYCHGATPEEAISALESKLAERENND